MKLGILWDMDGTLLNTLEDLQDAVNYVLRQYGCPARDGEEIRSFLGNGARNLIRCALAGTGRESDEERILADYLAYYNAHSQVKTGPYPGIPEALAVLGQKYPMAVVSNKPDPTVKLLGKTYFPRLFALGERSDCPRKPAPDMVKRAMEALGVESCIFVGDSEVDIETAKNAEVPCLSVLWGFRDRTDLEQAGGRYFCDDPQKLPQTLDEIVRSTYGQ